MAPTVGKWLLAIFVFFVRFFFCSHGKNPATKNLDFWKFDIDIRSVAKRF